MCSSPVSLTGTPRGMSWQRSGNVATSAGESSARSPGETPPVRGWALRPPAGYVTIGSVRYGVRFASTVGTPAAPSRPCAPPSRDGGHRDADCCCGVQLSWPRSPSPSPSRLPLPATNKHTIIRRGIFSRLNTGDVPHRPVSGGSAPQPAVYKSTLEWCAKKSPAKGGVRSCFRGADDADCEDGGLKMTRESPLATATSLRPRVLVRSKPQLPAYLQGKAVTGPENECLITSPHTLERLNRFRFGGGADRKEAQRPKKKRSSDKTERLRELTERLKSPSAASSPDRGQHSRDTSPAEHGQASGVAAPKPAGRLPTCSSVDHNKYPTAQKQPKGYNLKEPENQRIPNPPEGTPTEPRSLHRFGRMPTRSSPTRDKHQQTSKQQDYDKKQREDIQEQRKRLTKQQTVSSPPCSSPEPSQTIVKEQAHSPFPQEPSLSWLGTFPERPPSVSDDCVSNVGSAVGDNCDDIFLLHRPESRTIVGSYTQTKIPYRSASFSQVDYSSVDGKYVRNPGRTTSYGGYGGSHTLPRKKLGSGTPLEPIGSTPSVDSAVGSEEGFVASIASLAGEFSGDTVHRPGTRSLTHPLTSRGRTDDEIPFSSIDGNGMKGLLAVSRELQEVVEESETSSDNGTVTFCLGGDDDVEETVPTATKVNTEDDITGNSERKPQGSETTEAHVPEVEGSIEGERTEVVDDVFSDVVPLVADVLSEDRTETVETLASPWLFALERNRTIVPNLGKGGEYESAEIEKHKQYPVITKPTVVFQADVTELEEVTCDNPPEMLGDTTPSDPIPGGATDNHQLDGSFATQWPRAVSETVRGTGGRPRHDEEIDYSKECVRQCEEWLKELGEDFKTQNKSLTDGDPSEEAVQNTTEESQPDVSVELMSQNVDALREQGELVPFPDCEPAAISDEINPLGVLECPKLEIARSAPLPIERVETEKFNENLKKLPQNANEVAIITTPPQWTDDPSKRWSGGDGTGTDSDRNDWGSPSEEPQTPEDTTMRPQWPTPLGNRRWPLVYQSSDERDDETIPLSRPSPRRYLQVRTDSFSEGESEQGEGRPRTPSREDRDRTASPSLLTQSEDADARGKNDGSHEPRRHEPRRYSKRPLRGPYGQMLEAEMKKPETNRKAKLNYNEDLKVFLEEYRPVSPPTPSSPDMLSPNPRRNLASHSMDDSQLKGGYGRSASVSSPPSATRTSPKRKVSANLPFPCVEPAESGGLIARHQRTTSSPSTLDGYSGGPVRDARGRPEPTPELLAELLRGSSELLSASNSTINGNSLQDMRDTRTHVVVELYDTERNYVEALQILVMKYLQPLKSPENAGLVDAALVDEIFYQVPAILQHHELLLDELRKRLDNWDINQKIGDVFLDAFTRQPVIETYTSFINNWKSAKEAIKTTCQAKPAFARFIEAMAREHKGKLALDCLLIKPVQRIPRYELLIQRLLKHTDPSHPDHALLLEAQKEVHELAVKINCTERESLEYEQQQQTLKELENIIEGSINLVSSERTFFRHDTVTMASGQGTRKERALFLFSDLLVITSIKRRSGTIRKPSNTCPGSLASTLEANKYKLLMRIPLDDLEVVKSKDENLKKRLREMENLTEDILTLSQIAELTSALHCPHSQLEDLVKEMMSTASKQLEEQRTTDAQLSYLELTLNTQSGMENISVVFTKAEKRSWEDSFNEAKQKLALSADRRPSPEFVSSVPIRKTRAGLQFTCAASTLGLNAVNLRDVWVCNSDGYVGQVCVLSLHPEPNVISCNGVCNARILCVASIPAGITGPTSHCPLGALPFTHNKIGISISVEDADKSGGNIQLDSSSSSSDDDDEPDDRAQGIALPDDDVKRARSASDSHLPDRETISGQDRAGQSDTDTDSLQPTMWLGTEDGCIHVYNCSDNIRIKKNKVKIQHGSSVHCIIYLDNRVFVSLANGDITVYIRDQSGWNTTDPYTVSVGTAATPVTRMLPVAGKLWCGCHNSIKILNTFSLEVEHSFVVNADLTRSVTWLATAGLGAWISLHNSAIVRLFHATTFECLTEVNVAPAVNKMLASCDDIIRQHKAACLRVTSLLACKDLLWIGTSAGVILTMPLPHISPTTTKLATPPSASGVPHGHTGHVRFLTFVETAPSPSPDGLVVRPSIHHRYSLKAKPDINQSSTKLLVISGGDGYEDFRTSSASEVAGREDSTNHLLIWHV